MQEFSKGKALYTRLLKLVQHTDPKALNLLRATVEMLVRRTNSVNGVLLGCFDKDLPDLDDGTSVTT